MSETTSPNATTFPKASSRSISRRLHVYLAQAPDLLVGVAGLPQGRNDVQLQVRHVAGDQARLTLRDHPYLSYGRRQYARPGPFEPLGPSRVFDPHRVPHVREGEAAFGVGGLRVRFVECPAFEGEMRTSAAEYAAGRAVLQDEAGVRVGQV